MPKSRVMNMQQMGQHNLSQYRTNSGVVLVLGLVLLTSFALLGTFGVGGAKINQTLAYNDRVTKTTGQAAESGIAIAMDKKGWINQAINQIEQVNASVNQNLTLNASDNDINVTVKLKASNYIGTGTTLNLGSQFSSVRIEVHSHATMATDNGAELAGQRSVVQGFLRLGAG